MSIPEVDSKNRLLQFLRASLQRIDFLNITNNATVDGTLTAGAVNVTNNTAVSGTLTVGDGSLADEDTLLILNSDRAWTFKQSGNGSSAALMLQNTTGPNKDFIIKTNGETKFFDNDGNENASIDNDTGNMQIDGRMTVSTQPAFLVYLTADQTISSDGTYVTIQFTGEDYDTNNDFASYTFTAPVAGKYLFSANARIDSIPAKSTQWVQGKIRNTATGQEFSVGLVDLDGGADYHTVTGAVIMDLAATDTVDFQVAVKDVDGSATNVFGQSTQDGFHRTYFSGYLLG